MHPGTPDAYHSSRRADAESVVLAIVDGGGRAIVMKQDLRDPAAAIRPFDTFAPAGDAYDAPPEPLDAAVLFAPAGDLVPVALAALDRGGTLSIAGIHLTDIPVLNYQRHLFQERTVRSVTANTREDGREFLALAGRHRLRVTVAPYPLDAAARALALCRQVGARAGEVADLDTLGEICLDGGRAEPRRAEDLARAAVALAREVADVRIRVDAMNTLATIQYQLGRMAAAGHRLGLVEQARRTVDILRAGVPATA